MQSELPCLFFVADWHALTTHYDDPSKIEESTWDMLIDWLAAGVDPSQSTLFIQSKVPEHAELHLLLSMSTPLGWLERVPTYKDQQEKLADRDLATYGFLGYPLLQAADVLIYRASLVPVGEDQIPHIEMMREIARRFNHLYGKEKGFEEKAREAVKKLGGKRAKIYTELRTAYQEQGKDDALAQAKAMLDDAQNLSMIDRERLFGYAKPVPVEWGNLRKPKRDMAWVALAGPAANFVMALLWMIFAIALVATGVNEPFFTGMARAGVLTNLVMFAFNLFPIPPLDGGRVMTSLLPHRYAYKFAKIEPYGFFIVMGLVMLKVLYFWMVPVMTAAHAALLLMTAPLNIFLN
jgi:tryptophanyl-tRNA synthetase